MLADSAKEQTIKEPSPGRVIRVLVLDDNPADIDFIAHCIRRIDHWTVQVMGCGSLDAALALTSQEEFELLFIDYWLGSFTGTVALEELRRAGVEAPAILMTGMRSEDVILEALQAGAIDYMPKDSLSRASVQRVTRNAIEKADLSRAVREKHHALIETVQRLEERQEEIESFYHNVSHELKTPLTAAREFVALVVDRAMGPLSDDQAELLEATLRNCDQMAVCVNDMLDATRLDTGKLSLFKETHDLCAIVHDVAMSLQLRAAAVDIQIVVEAPPEALMLDLDQHRIYQVLSNLVANAIKFSPNGSQVRMVVEDSDDDSIAVQVIDCGSGLSCADQERVFERLYQSSAKDAATLGGLGLGLYICRQILELHGGQISVAGELGVGCTFTFRLPRR